MNQICQTGFAQPMVTKQISMDTDRNVVRVKVAQHELLLYYVVGTYIIMMVYELKLGCLT